MEKQSEFDRFVLKAEEAVGGGNSISSDGYILRGICFAILALAVAIREQKTDRAENH